MDRESGHNVASADGESVGEAGAIAVEAKGALEARPSPVLVTGASGFVGSAIAAALRARGHDVRVLVASIEPAHQSRSRRHGVRGRPPRSRLAGGGAEGRPLPLSRRRRLSALGARPGRDPPQQCRGNAAHHGGGAPRRRRAHRLHQQRRDPEAHRRRRRDGGRAARRRRGDRRLQAQQGRGRASGRGHGPARRAAGRHRQSVDADRPARRAADADRPHHRRGRVGTHAGLRGHGAQPRPCR